MYKEPFLTGKRETDPFDVERIFQAVEKTYEEDGLDPETLRLFMLHNRQVLDFVRQIGAGEKFDEREQEISELAAALHDFMKGRVPFEEHGDAGGLEAEKILQAMGRSSELARSVRLAIERHMGNSGFVGERAKAKYGEDFRYPEPATRVGECVYEADMLTILTDGGVEKLLHLRSTVPELMREDEVYAEQHQVTPEDARFTSVKGSVLNSLAVMKLESSIHIAKALVSKLNERYPKLNL